MFKKEITWEVNENGCHICTSHALTSRYPCVTNNGVTMRISRLFYSNKFLGGKPIPDKMLILHSCDTPACINIDHLRMGTHVENMQDKKNRGRGNNPVGEKHHSSKLKPFQIIKIRQSAATISSLAVLYGVSETSIRDIRKLKNWKHIK